MMHLELLLIITAHHFREHALVFLECECAFRAYQAATGFHSLHHGMKNNLLTLLTCLS